ncbi:MAG: hypothetical protein QXI43_00210 [Candidatus Nitrosocaldus sp.]
MRKNELTTTITTMERRGEEEKRREDEGDKERKHSILCAIANPASKCNCTCKGKLHGSLRGYK